MKNYFDVPKISGDKEPPCKHYRGLSIPLSPFVPVPLVWRAALREIHASLQWILFAGGSAVQIVSFLALRRILCQQLALWTELVSSLTVLFVSVDFWCFRFATANRLHVSCSGKTEGPLWWINVHTIVCCVTVTSNQCSVTAIAYWKQRTV